MTPGSAEVDAGSPASHQPAPDADIDPARRRYRTGKLHLSTTIVLVAGLGVTLALSIGAQVSIASSTNRALRTQLNEAAAALQSNLSGIADPLVAADVNAAFGVRAFRQFARSLVGARSPFLSISLWELRDGRPRELVAIGQRPGVPTGRGDVPRFLKGVRPSTSVAIAGVVTAPVRQLALAVREPGSSSRFVVYAESPLPDGPHLRYAPGSPLSGLSVAVYLGRTTVPGALLGTSQRTHGVGSTGRLVVRFGDTTATIVTTLAARLSGVLPSQLPWEIGVGGFALCGAVGLTTERLARRREVAERTASSETARYTTQRDIAETLQHSLLPKDDLTHDGVEIAARYSAGVAQLDVGGDWYDVVSLDADRLFVTVGDVSGRGLGAATVMGLLRHAIRAYATQGDDPATVVRKLDGLVDIRRDRCFATVLCAALDLTTGLVTISSAGHPPPLLIAGGARYLPTPVSTPIGVEGGPTARSSTYSLPVGATLVVYTDGLVERRGTQIDVGLEALRTRAAAATGSVDALLEDLVAALVDDPARDDVAILGVRPSRRGPEVIAWEDRSLFSTDVRRFPSTPASVHEARAFAIDVVRGQGLLAPGAVDDVALLVSELATNAVRHAGSDFDVTVQTADDATAVRVAVRDAGTGVPVCRDLDAASRSGRGMQIVNGVASAWGVEWHDDGASKSVWFEYLARPTPAS